MRAAAAAAAPDALQCTGPKTEPCLSAAQVGALASVLDGPKDSAGRRLYEPYPIDAGVVTWRAAMLGTSTTGTPNASRATNTSVKLVFMTPPRRGLEHAGPHRGAALRALHHHPGVGRVSLGQGGAVGAETGGGEGQSGDQTVRIHHDASRESGWGLSLLISAAK